MGEGVRLAAVAIAIGLAASFALSRMMASLLFGVVAENPLLLLALPLPLRRGRTRRHIPAGAQSRRNRSNRRATPRVAVVDDRSASEVHWALIEGLSLIRS